jgi:FkbM family methyltransferase
MFLSWIHTKSASKENGEYLFYRSIKPNLRVVFDVGCREDSDYLEFPGEVHYFDPVPRFIEDLKKLPTQNSSYYNCFGLGEEESISYYYPTYQSFHNRITSCGQDDTKNRLLFEIKRGDSYMNLKGITEIDFLKIDTEGHELAVLKGFGESLRNVKIIQFEYGGCYLDSKITLKETVDYLAAHGFGNFAKLTPTGTTPLTQIQDDFQYSNIVCFNGIDHPQSHQSPADETLCSPAAQ